MSVNSFLSALKKVKKMGEGRYISSCPAHDDKSPSLSVRVDTNGKIIMHCFGCGASGVDVCNALGIEVSALFPPSDNPRYEKQNRVGFSVWQLFNCMQDDLIRLVAIANHLKDIKALPDDDRKFIGQIAIKISEGLSYLEGVQR